MSQIRIQKKKFDYANYFKRYWFIYAILAPVLLYYIIFKYVPMYGLVIAFKKYSPVKGILASDWIGLDNYRKFFSSVFFLRVFKNTIILNLINLVFAFPAPIIFALLLNEIRNLMFKRTIQTISYLPHFISIVVVSGIMFDFLGSNGTISTLLNFLFGMEKQVWLNNMSAYRPIYVISDIWKELGWGAIIYMAALSSVDMELYDAASIDGCGTFRKMLHVTLPGIATTIIIMFILRIGQMLNVGSEKTLLLYNPNTYEVSDVISSFVYRRGFGIDARADYSFSTAVDLFNQIINLALLTLANAAARRYSESSLW